MLVKNYGCYAYDIAENSSQHARALLFDREVKRVTESAWHQAVNDTANLWQSIFWHALGPGASGVALRDRGIVKVSTNGSPC